MTKDIGKKGNPLFMHKNIRRTGGEHTVWTDMASAFNQVYDYALQLQGQLSGCDKKSLFQVGNVLKCLERSDTAPLYVLVCNRPDSNEIGMFSAVVLFDGGSYNDTAPGFVIDNWNMHDLSDTSWWELSSMKEVSNEG